jgi:hypothetical protein
MTPHDFGPSRSWLQRLLGCGSRKTAATAPPTRATAPASAPQVIVAGWPPADSAPPVWARD